ncbi:stage II sporulation protein AB (anti-sigma F factor) [Alteribacillus persepolensis]|uniref:Anti-sigma F factor n=1 Tax=Alteribacillus persepolensis TaxID=568899 RepID=A0A1G7ZNR7_9BACI|nr:anti-sigma F factor [Alteribacillus persepolensis]SDH10299.1 stage II sporulation protein AB (anti-sigma F factor) [Alteribacillus persepolensis]
MKNEMKLEFSAVSENESFARVSVGAFAAQVDPNMDELTELKTVVSEAVTNSIIHGYNENPNGTITIMVKLDAEMIELTVKDNGIGMEDIDKAKEPLYTSKPELERSGMGFTIMENFMDEVEVISNPGTGTTVYLKKRLAKSRSLCN